MSNTPVTHLPAAIVVPDNAAVRFILGQPCFTIRDIARRLEQLGLYAVKRKAEDEQAIVLHWELNLYLQHGDAWMAEGDKILKGPAPTGDQPAPASAE